MIYKVSVVSMCPILLPGRHDMALKQGTDVQECFWWVADAILFAHFRLKQGSRRFECVTYLTVSSG